MEKGIVLIKNVFRDLDDKSFLFSCKVISGSVEKGDLLVFSIQNQFLILGVENHDKLIGNSIIIKIDNSIADIVKPFNLNGDIFKIITPATYEGILK